MESMSENSSLEVTTVQSYSTTSEEKFIVNKNMRAVHENITSNCNHEKVVIEMVEHVQEEHKVKKRIVSCEKRMNENYSQENIHPNFSRVPKNFPTTIEDMDISSQETVCSKMDISSQDTVYSKMDISSQETVCSKMDISSLESLCSKMDIWSQESFCSNSKENVEPLVDLNVIKENNSKKCKQMSQTKKRKHLVVEEDDKENFDKLQSIATRKASLSLRKKSKTKEALVDLKDNLFFETTENNFVNFSDSGKRKRKRRS